MERIGLATSEAHARRIVDSYKRWTGQELIPLDEAGSCSEQLFQAPVVVLSHGTEADPVLNYGNEAALKLWEMDWEQFTRTPSRLTAEPMERSARQAFLQAVGERGYVDDYTGIRISRRGHRFYIVNAVVWNLLDEQGEPAGQAAAFREYRYCSERDRLSAALHRLFDDAGYEVPELAALVGLQEEREQAARRLEELSQENAKLKQELRRLTSAASARAGAGGMSSKLRDALRE